MLAILVAATSGCLLVDCQFLPQSHLGRLVQSIASPLVLSTSSGYGDSDSDSGAGYYTGEAAGSTGAEPSSASASASAANLGTGTGNGGAYDGRSSHQATSGLQQAPSQQRGVPTQHNNYYSGHDDERDQGSAPSNNKHTQDYQMGAYLGPSMDDKEINGAFNSNDERDEDDGPAGYDGPSSSSTGGGRNRAAASDSYHNNNYINTGGGGGYGADSNHGRGQQMGVVGGYGAPSYGGSSSYDEDSADEDDGPASGMSQGRRGSGQRAMDPSSGAHLGYGRSGLSQAASQYQQQGSFRGGNSPMMAAANSGGFGAGFGGYSGGPVDLQGLMAGVSGDPSSGYQVYNGDGSYPGANYYQQQLQAQRGNRNQNDQEQAALRGTQDVSKNEQDEHENEGDDD